MLAIAFRLSRSPGSTTATARSGAGSRAPTASLKIRLSGIAARELDGTCSPGHPCPAANAQAAKAELERLALGQVLSCRAVGRTYGRVTAFCRRADGVDLSCAMVASGTAARWERYWQGHRR